jgi:hypothetical protein
LCWVGCHYFNNRAKEIIKRSPVVDRLNPGK